ncbi:MAG: 3'-5' exoribonuclease [Clostridia bacterium]|jgi:DNA polymerase III alpha subunit (gram-positive type)|nr:3'-5' exoribonuclease [Clostridia bacterium]
MSYFSFDIETNGPCPGKYSIVEIGATMIKSDGTFETFFSNIAPISNEYDKEYLDITGHVFEETLNYEEPIEVINNLNNWVKENNTGKAKFVSDNAFDWMFICTYFHEFLGECPFGHTSFNINSFYRGMEKDLKAEFSTKSNLEHTHNALDDSMKNADALFNIFKENNMLSELDI